MITLHFSSQFNFVSNHGVSDFFHILGGSTPLFISFRSPNGLIPKRKRKLLFLSQLTAAGQFLIESRDLFIKKFFVNSTQNGGENPGVVLMFTADGSRKSYSLKSIKK